ncbi:integrase core domain-containing protein [Leisingera sp. M523]|nr:integrase core domain-containing protein [Leisingera sp. M523]
MPLRVSLHGEIRFLPRQARAPPNSTVPAPCVRSPSGRSPGCAHLHAWESGSEAKAGIRKWMAFYNHKRPHSALGGKPPAMVYWLRKDGNQTDQQEQRVA